MTGWPNHASTRTQTTRLKTVVFEGCTGFQQTNRPQKRVFREKLTLETLCCVCRTLMERYFGFGESASRYSLWSADSSTFLDGQTLKGPFAAVVNEILDLPSLNVTSLR